MKWRPTTCRPTGRPSTSPAGIEIAGLPWRLAGNVSLPLLPALSSTPPNVLGQRAVGGEGDVGVAGRDDQVDAVDGVEDLGHRLVDLHPPALDDRPRRGVVDADGVAQAAADLRGQVVGAVRPAVAELGDDVDRPADRPGPAHARQAGVDAVDARQPGVGDQLLGGAAEHVPHRRRDHGAAPVVDDGDAQAAQLVGRACRGRPPSPRRAAGSAGRAASWPLATSNQRAVSRTERARHPTVTVRLPYLALGDMGMRPNVPSARRGRRSRPGCGSSRRRRRRWPA